MSEPEEKYTLPRVLEIVPGHAQAISSAGKALEATEGKDPEVLAMLGERAQWAKEALWAIENTAGIHDSDVGDAWETSLPHILYALPLLVLATDGVDVDPKNAKESHWCHYEAERIAEVLMDWVTKHEKTPPKTTTTEEPQEAEEAEEHESKQLMPMEAFEAMADALRPLVNGLWAMEEPSEVGDVYVDRSEPNAWKFTEQGCVHLDDVIDTALAGLRRLARYDHHHLKYLPKWCYGQLTDTKTTLERVAWILCGASIAANGTDASCELPGPGPYATGHAYWMIRGPFKDLCVKYEEYKAADEIAIDQDYADAGWTKDRDGRRVAPPSVLEGRGEMAP